MKTMKLIKACGILVVAFIFAVVAGMAWDANATTLNRHWLEMVIRWFFFAIGMAGSIATGFLFVCGIVSQFLDE